MTLRAVAILTLLCILAVPAAAGQAPQRMVINADLGRDTISRHIYGHFAEHLGRGIYDGIWRRAGTGEWQLREDVIHAEGRIHITLANLDPNRARTINAHNTFEQPNTVRPAAFTGARLTGEALMVQLPPESLVVLELR